MYAYDAGLGSHCVRVAAWAHELSGMLKLNQGEERWLEQSALLHHLPLEMMDTETVDRLAGDLWPAGPQVPAAIAKSVPQRVRAVLEAMRQPGGRALRTDRIAAIADIVELANLFDE